ncbi:MAG: OmpA/MotB family protein [Gammaproteobacteria bacterium]
MIYNNAKSEEDNWVSTSDLMAGLMIIFLFIAIAYIKSIGQEEKQAANDICNQLESAFEDFKWRDRIEVCIEPLVVRFTDPETLFERGSASLTRDFQQMLEAFIPRYMSVVDSHQSQIGKIRIEGHTDDAWGNEQDPIAKFYNNMYLSQSRTYSVLHFSLQQKELRKEPEWAIKHLESVGRSSSDPIVAENGGVDHDRSRRVDFRIQLNIRAKRLGQLAGVDIATN